MAQVHVEIEVTIMEQREGAAVRRKITVERVEADVERAVMLAWHVVAAEIEEVRGDGS